MNVYKKDPDAVLDYQFDWSDWLTTDEVVSSSTITISPVVATVGLSAGTPTVNSGVVKVWLSNGVTGANYTVACEIVTNQSRTDERSILIQCLDR